MKSGPGHSEIFLSVVKMHDLVYKKWFLLTCFFNYDYLRDETFQNSVSADTLLRIVHGQPLQLLTLTEMHSLQDRKCFFVHLVTFTANISAMKLSEVLFFDQK